MVLMSRDTWRKEEPLFGRMDSQLPLGSFTGLNTLLSIPGQGPAAGAQAHKATVMYESVHSTS